MSDRLLLLALGVGLGWLLRDRAPRRGPTQTSIPVPEGRELEQARAALERLNRGLATGGQGDGPAFASAPGIEDVARLYGPALAAAEDAHAEILDAWGRLPSNATLGLQDEAMTEKRLHLANATIAAVLEAPDVAAALATIRGQITDLRTTARRMKDATAGTVAAAAAADAVAGVAGLAGSFNGK